MKEYVVIRKLANENKFEEAIKKARDAKDKDERVMLLCTIAEAMVYEGKIEDAISLLNESFEMAKEIDDEFAKSLAIGKISFTMAVAGRVEDAIKMAESIGDDAEKVYVMAKISHLLMKRGKDEKAWEILKEAEEMIYEMRDGIGKILSINDVAHSLLDMGKEDEALSLIKYAESIAEKMNDENASVTFGLIAPVAMELGRFDYAMKLVERVKEKYDKTWLLSDVAHEKRDVNLLKKAVEIAREMKPRYEKVSAMTKIASMMADLGRRQEAEELINECIGILGRIKYKVGRAMAMAVISHAMFKNGDERYDDMLKQAMEIADGLDIFEAEYACSLIARVMIEIGKFEDALKFMDGIKDEKMKMWLYLSIAYDLIAEEREEDAMRIAEFFDDRILKRRIMERRSF